MWGLLALALVVAAWASAAGPTPLFETTGTVPLRRGGPPPFDLGDASDLNRTLGSRRTAVAPSWLAEILTWVLVVLVGLVAVAVAVAIAVAVARRRRQHPSLPATSGPLDVLPEVLTADLEEQRRALREVSLPTNAIIACWIRLERAVEAAGVTVDPALTSTETTVFVLRRHAVDPVALGALAELYREARFSAHPLGEDRREEALGHLEHVHADLRRAMSQRESVGVGATPAGSSRGPVNRSAGSG